MKPMRFLAFSGSLRKRSYNTAALEALQVLAPPSIKMIISRELGNLPLFNPDREEEDIPALSSLKTELAQADGLIIASP